MSSTSSLSRINRPPNNNPLGKKNPSPLELRIREEIHLFTKQWISIVIVVIFLVYIVLMVFLNLSYHRYEPPPDGKRLKDIGYELIPEIPHRHLNIVDLPLNALYFVAGILIIGTFRACLPSYSGIKSPPYIVNILRRFGVAYSMGHFLRACTYLVTTIPGGTEKCLKRETLESSRPTLSQCFYRTASVETNCGDLMFSGHLLLCIIIVCMCYRYGNDCLANPKWAKILFYFAILLTTIEFVMILAARHHYTSDLIVSIYVTPLMWYSYNTIWEPFDLEPDHLDIERMIEIHGGPWFSRQCCRGRLYSKHDLFENNNNNQETTAANLLLLDLENDNNESTNNFRQPLLGT
jgi:hypothetical protein